MSIRNELLEQILSATSGGTSAPLYAGYIDGWIGPTKPITTQASATTIDITAGDFLYVNKADPKNITYTEVAYAGVTGYTPVFIGTTAETSYLYVDVSTGLLVEKNAPDQAAAPELSYIGNVDFVQTTTPNDTINGVNVFINTAYSSLQTADKIQLARGAYNLSGCVYNAKGLLELGHTAGVGVRVGVSTVSDVTNPDTASTAVDSIALTVKAHVDSAGDLIRVIDFTNNISPDVRVDPLTGNLTTVGAAKYTVQYIYHFYGSDVAFIYYTTIQENTLILAEEKVRQGGAIDRTTITNEAQLRSALIVRGGATDLTIAADAKFIRLGD